MLRGEVWWGTPTLTGGSRKHRPFVVVSDDSFNTNDRYPKVMVVHLTTVRRAAGPYTWEVDIPDGTAGLDRTSVVKCAEVYTFLKAQMDRRAGTVPREIMERVDRALAVALSLPGAPPG